MNIFKDALAEYQNEKGLTIECPEEYL